MFNPMKYEITLVTNVTGYVSEKVVETFEGSLRAAIDYFMNKYAYDYEAGYVYVETKEMHEMTDGKVYQHPVITYTVQNGDNWWIYKMPLWVSE